MNTIKFKTFLFLLFTFCINVNAEEKVIDRICGDYNVRVDIWGYNMSNVSGYSSWDFWDYYGYVWDDEGETFNYHYGESPSGGYLPYSHFPTIEKIDETTVRIHNLLRDFQGLFTNPEKDYTIIAVVDEQNMTLTIPAQMYGEDIYIGKTCSYEESGVQIENIAPVVFSIAYSGQYVVLQTKGNLKFPYEDDATFALFFENENKTGYYANIGYCTAFFFTQGQYITYDYNYTSIDPEQGIVSELSALKLHHGRNTCVNDKLVDGITIQKNGKPIDVKCDFYVDRLSDMYTMLELPAPITEEGIYEITFPAGLIGDLDYQAYDFKSGHANPEFTLTYTITAGGDKPSDVATFEDLALDSENYWAGDEKGEEWYDGLGYQQRFKSGDYSFKNCYLPDWDSWVGFAYSNKTATTYSGLADQYNSCVGSGNNGSENYCVAYPDGTMWGEDFSIKVEKGTKVVPGFYITNTAWVVKSILEGDGMTDGAFALGDYFKITIHALDAEGNETAKRDFCLADYRFADESERYYVKDWTYVDLSKLGEATEFTFTFDGTKKNSYGLTTPTYFCIDDFGAEGTEDVKPEGTETGIDNIQIENNANATLYDLQGVKVDSKSAKNGVYIRKVGAKTEKVFIR